MTTNKNNSPHSPHVIVRKGLWDTCHLWTAQVVVSSIAFGFCVWLGAECLKLLLIGHKTFNLYSWTQIFFHPVQANRINYITLCVTMGSISLIFYLFCNEKRITWLKQRLYKSSCTIFFITIPFSLFILILVSLTKSFPLRVMGSIVVAALPVTWLVPWAIDQFLSHRTVVRYVSTLFIAGLVMLVTAELTGLILGPAHLMNEYAGIYGETIVGRKYVDNKVFLTHLQEDDVDATSLFIEISSKLNLLRTVERDKSKPLTLYNILKPYRTIDLRSSQDYFRSVLSSNPSVKASIVHNYAPDPTRHLERLNSLDVEALKEFYLSNALENRHQNMGRGQVNHIGHIINPLNEYRLGKPIRETYIQYGLGNTFLMKWVMDLFGGISYQNYYKTYILYIAYYLLFLLMLIYLFRDSLFVLGAYVAISICFFLMGYVNLVIAPGIIPSIHLLDAPALMLLVAFLRHRTNLFYLGLLTVCPLFAIVVNGQFGLSLSFAFIATAVFHVLENSSGRTRAGRLFILVALSILYIAVWRFSNIGIIGSVFSYFWDGLFSWPAPTVFVFLTIAYLVVSYGMFFFLKKSRSEWKYVYIFVSLYNQAALLYFYWSGLPNHVPPVLPFFWLQVFVMFRAVKDTLSQSYPLWILRIDRMAVLATGFAFVVLLPAFAYFHYDKGAFYGNFFKHRTYNWTFENASVVTTIPPTLIGESIALIQKFDEPHKSPSVHILSRYDGLLPFLANRYSAMPFFDLTSYLFSETEYNQALHTIQTDKPEYLFVDTEINNCGDLWNILYKNDPFYALERTSRTGRYNLLQEIFRAVKKDYEMIEEGGLISVYKRKSLCGADLIK